jgi:hypothetical protein
MSAFTNPDNYSKIRFLFELMRDPERKSILKMISEMIYLGFVHKDYPGHYFSRYLFKKGKTNILDYYPWRFLYNMKAYFNESKAWDVLENKLYFDFFYRQFNISLPEILMYNHRRLFVRDNKTAVTENVDHFKVLLNECFDKTPLSDSIFLKKTYWSYGGDKIFKIYRQQLNSDPDLIAKLYAEVIKSGYLVQETVRQHPDLDSLNPSSLNTIRFDTYIDPDGKTELISGYLRMSIRNQPVDNISSGGVLVGINLETGRLKKEGFSNLQDLGTRILTFHPVTLKEFDGFEIPFFDKARELVIKAASLMPALRLVGWDVAISESGPVLIEGNSDYDNTGNDLSEGGYRTNPVFRKVLEEYKILKRLKHRKD